MKLSRNDRKMAKMVEHQPKCQEATEINENEQTWEQATKTNEINLIDGKSVHRNDWTWSKWSEASQYHHNEPKSANG